MKMPRSLIGLTVLNFGLLVFLLTQIAPRAEAESAAPMLRGRGLEIVDSQGRLRASIGLIPASLPGTNPAYPETVILRLIDSNGRPSVKISNSVKGAGISLVGEGDATYIVLESEGLESSLRMLSKGRPEHSIRP